MAPGLLFFLYFNFFRVKYSIPHGTRFWTWWTSVNTYNLVILVIVIFFLFFFVSDITSPGPRATVVDRQKDDYCPQVPFLEPRTVYSVEKRTGPVSRAEDSLFCGERKEQRDASIYITMQSRALYQASTCCLWVCVCPVKLRKCIEEGNKPPFPVKTLDTGEVFSIW